MRMIDIPKDWRKTRIGIWHQPRLNLRNGVKVFEWKIYYELKCALCGSDFVHPLKIGKFCTRECQLKSIKRWGADHPRWKGGRAEIAQGYIWIRIGYKKYRAEHILKIEKKIGRKLAKNEVVHHKNGIKNDNRISNLVLMTRSSHASHHHK